MLLFSEGKDNGILYNKKIIVPFFPFMRDYPLIRELNIKHMNKEIEQLTYRLRANGLTLSTAESCTGGYIAHRLVLPPGASVYYKGSIIAYDNQVKIDQLDVEHQLLNTYGAVSKEVAERMAKGVAAKLTTDCSIAVSGVMGPDGGTPEKPVGTVWIATFFHGRVHSICYHLTGNRIENIKKTCELALLQLIRMLEEEPFSLG